MPKRGSDGTIHTSIITHKSSPQLPFTLIALVSCTHLLRRTVPRVVVAGGQRIGAQDDAALDLVAEAGLTNLT